VRCILLLVLLSIAPAVWSQTAGEDAGSVVEHCSDLASDETYGLTDLEKECPGLTQALEELGYLQLLSSGTRDTLHVYDLADLLQVDDWYGDQQARNIDVATLAPILTSLRAEKPEHTLTWFERLKRWLRSLLERQQDAPDRSLPRWLLGDLDLSSIVRVLLLGSLILVVVLAIAVIYNELRVSGMLRKRTVLHDAAVNAASNDALAAGELEDLDRLSADRKPPMLLRMLVATLIKSGRLRTERSLTYRELCTRATFDDTQQRDSFRRVAVLAERVVYGGGTVSAEEVEPMVAAARALDAQLRGAPA
jgi:hypothetical protein